MYPNRQSSVRQQRVHDHVKSSDSYAFFNMLTSPELLDEVESQLPLHRERLFPPTETLSMFLAQALNTHAGVTHAGVRSCINTYHLLSFAPCHDL